MATHDLTADFLQRRATAVRKRHAPSGRNTPDGSYTQLAAGGAGDHDLMLSEEGGIQLGSLNHGSASPPSWVRDANAVETCLTEIQQHCRDLQSMHAQRVGAVFGKDLADMEVRIDRTTSDITEQFRYAERLLQQVGRATRSGSNAQTALVGANLQRNLAKRLQEQSVLFRQSQRKYLAEVQAQKSGGMVPEFGIEFNGSSDGNGNNGNGNHSDFFSSTPQQLTVVDDLTAAVQSRDTEIVKIAQSIEELGSIFKELAVLVIDQGTILDRIDYNMEAVVESTKTGLSQLEKAERSQKNARPMRCIICLACTIFVLMVLLVLKHKRW